MNFDRFRDGPDSESLSLRNSQEWKKLLNVDNIALQHYVNEDLLAGIGEIIVSNIDVNDKAVRANILGIWENGDYRLVSDYIHAFDVDSLTSDLVLKSLHDSLSEFQINLLRYKRSVEVKMPDRKSEFVETMGEIFSIDDDSSTLKILLLEEAYRDSLEELIEITNGDLIGFIESFYDLEGRNYLVRQGLVKKGVLPDGARIVTKRSNPDKEGRFRTEQENILGVITKLGLSNMEDFVDLGIGEHGKAIRLKMIKPVAVLVDSITGFFYSISPHQIGNTLEELLVKLDSAERNQYLADARIILEHLYDKGILWGDMAPRNIIVNFSEGVVEYYILDFEKSFLRESEIEFTDRVEHCRGPMCVEEFGAVCFRDEVEKCFEPYFAPDTWELSSQEQISFRNPKRELMAIFDGRGEEVPTIGDYNRLEKEVMEVRFPFVENGKVHYPLDISFKVDHYLGSDYDRKTTELFMYARSIDKLGGVVGVLSGLLEMVDNAFLLQDFNNLITGRSNDVNKFTQIDSFSDVVDRLYGCVGGEEDFNLSLLEIQRLMN